MARLKEILSDAGERKQQLVNSTDSEGYTLLQIAIIRKNPEALRILGAEGADPNMRNKYKQCAIHIAAQRNDAEAVEALVAIGARVDRDGYGHWPSWLARKSGFEGLARQLRAHERAQESLMRRPGLMLLRKPDHSSQAMPALPQRSKRKG